MPSALLLASLVLAACSPPRAPVAPKPPPPTAPAADPDATVAITRIRAGAAPGPRSSHHWGSRRYELRVVDGVTQFRMHDVWHFQGSGMRPDQMPPARHRCSAWEPLPTAIVPLVPLHANSCADAKEGCAAIRRWLAATEGALRQPLPVGITRTDVDPQHGRPGAACDG